MFRENDIKQFKSRGLDPKEVEKQIGYFKQGFPFMKLAKAASVGHGIVLLSSKQIEDYAAVYEHENKIDKIKFVPASGAASRMFKALFEFDESFKQANFDSRTITNEAYKHVKEFFDRIHEFAFYDELNHHLKRKGKSIDDLIQRHEYHLILAGLLGPEGMNYGNLPKGLLAFHRYNNQARTSVEEHLVEGAGYAVNNNKKVRIHLTVSSEHLEGFEKLVKKVKENYEAHYKVIYEISFSIQKPSTDTIAVEMNNEPFREKDGSLHFRPGGHGALLENLNDLDADIVFIKNIDNVVPDRYKPETITYKKALAGILVDIRTKVFNYLNLLESSKEINNQKLQEISRFLEEDLCIHLSRKQLANPNSVREIIAQKLNRPIRICGMVKNQGEPGGGPFWATNPDGSVSLQIVETSQVNHHDPEQEAILQSSSHFNPVDLICSIKDFKGKKFNLLKYTDPRTGFISKKSKNGKPLKALELPGLWNGAMSDWITIFVEVPTGTFSPVKTVSDLLRPEHLADK